MKRQRLTAAFVRSCTEPGRHTDGPGGHGLSLLCKARKSGGWARSWSQRIRVDGRWTSIGLGSAAVVTLAEARAAALENARKVRQGDDPRAAGEARVPTFAEAAEQVIQLHAPNWRKGPNSSERIWRNSLATYAYPSLGSRPVDEITSQDIMGIIGPLWNVKRETARRLKGKVSVIMSWAATNGYRLDDPAAAISARVLPGKARKPKHYRSLHYADVPEAISTIRQCGKSEPAKACLEFMALTACRPGEARGARWAETNLDARLWTIPASRMKSERQHKVPLSDSAVAVLGHARGFRGDRALVFPSVQGGAEMATGTLGRIMRDLGISASPHGFRSSFRVWTQEQTDTPREVAEAALAHTTGTKVEQAYARSDYLALRVPLMDDWGRHCTGTAPATP